jgi:hypothetical protein
MARMCSSRNSLSVEYLDSSRKKPRMPSWPMAGPSSGEAGLMSSMPGEASFRYASTSRRSSAERACRTTSTFSCDTARPVSLRALDADDPLAVNPCGYVFVTDQIGQLVELAGLLLESRNGAVGRADRFGGVRATSRCGCPRQRLCSDARRAPRVGIRGSGGGASVDPRLRIAATDAQERSIVG